MTTRGEQQALWIALDDQQHRYTTACRHLITTSSAGLRHVTCPSPTPACPLIPQFILMLSDAQPIVQDAFRHWHGQIDDEDDTDGVSWTPAHVWAMILADFASILDQL